MILLRLGVFLVALSLAAPRFFAWGVQGHRIVNERSVMMLPADLRPFFQNNLGFVKEHSIDPDLWKEDGMDLEANHFFNLDSFGEYPFPTIPLQERDFVRRFGEGAVRQGRVQWRIQEVYESLRKQMKSGDWKAARLSAAVLGHYVGDAHVPLHATKNYDGQLSGNAGVHSRWEAQLVERFEEQILKNLRFGQVTSIENVPAFTFEILKQSYLASRSVLKNDSASAAGMNDYLDTPYDDRYSHSYFSRFFSREEANIIERLNSSSLNVARFWYSAWIEAGRPRFPDSLKDERVRGDHKLLILSWDGTPVDLVKRMLTEGKLPNLNRLVKQASFSDRVKTGYPSLTAPGNAVAWTGAWGYRNGVTANQIPYAASATRTVLEYLSGFSSATLEAEPIWAAAARQGLNVTVLQAVQAFPFESIHPEKSSGVGQNRRLTILDGYAGEASADGIIDQSVGLREATGWKGLPDLAGRALEFSFRLQQTTFYGVLFDSPDDPSVGYDTLLLSPSESDRNRFVFLKDDEPESWLDNRFSGPVEVKTETGTVPVHFRLFELARSQPRFVLYHSWIYQIASNRPDLLKLYAGRMGGFWSHGAIRLYRSGSLGKPLYNGGNGTAESRYLETLALAVRQFTTATQLALKGLQWDLLMNYSPFPDEACHAWYGWLDPSSPAYNPELARKVNVYLEAVLDMLDDSLGLILKALPDGVGLALLSDHGMQGVAKDFLPNVLLKKVGLLVVRAQGEIDLSKTKICAVAEGAFLVVNSMKRKEGIVPESEVDMVVQQAKRALLGATDPQTGKPIVVRVFDPQRDQAKLGIGGPRGGDLYFELAEGYGTRASCTGGAIVQSRLPAGNHAVNARTAETGFLLAGPGVRKCKSLGPAALVDVAPTLCDFLGIDPPSQSLGGVLSEAFE